jgi:hypothetical protein
MTMVGMGLKFAHKIEGGLNAAYSVFLLFMALHERGAGSRIRLGLSSAL